ncbi:PTS sugar transporter subunit IIC [Brachybacterium ginsengisoli]|uniref:PTS sugar transporter subunit IIC n=1 Tax=Brachybacterium ginsengisoli TaxID=1331682 RepID=A0A291H0K0_9MICO|nr:PTS transporter subunit IIC [Brachybacterium ginsengisoli]ATG55983.1 PTS sugar transporter subunit IIC [Brachybacterium ginsengisoli]
MESFLAPISSYLNTLGPSVVLPVLITLFGLLLGLKLGKSFRAGVTIGIGFIGINLVIGLLGSQVAPAATGMAEGLGVTLDVVDVGWPSSAAIAFGSTIGAMIIPLGLVVNVLLLLTGLTRTFDIDLWNYWHSAMIGALVGAVTGSFLLGLLSAAVHLALILAIGDLTAPIVQKYFQLPEISFPHGTSAPYGLLAIPLNRVFDAIPGLRSLDATPEAIQKRFGLFGETLMMGLVLGLLIGILGYGFDAPAEDSTAILTLAISLAAAMFLLPRMVAILMEGLMPISEAARAFVQKRFPGRTFYIGLDSAVAVGQPSVIATSLLLVPITLLIAVVLSPAGNRVLPLVDLATIPFIVAVMVPIFRGNIVRSVIGGGVLIGAGLFIATWIAPAFTRIAVDSGFALEDGQATISSLVDGANPLTGLFFAAAELGPVGVLVTAVLCLAAVVAVRVVMTRRDRRALAGAEDEAAAVEQGGAGA